MRFPLRPYEAYAEVYDRVTIDFWQHHVRTLDGLLPPPVGAQPRALDLACGTGAGIGYLSSRGYSVVGVDLAPEMIRIARLRHPGADLIVADMRDIPPLGKFDVVICCFDSINYLLDAAEWLSLFKGVRRSLRAGGMFVFDTLRAEDVARSWDGQSRVEEWPDFTYLERCTLNRARGTGVTDRTFFRREASGLWCRTEERHEQMAFPRSHVRAWLRQAGFDAIRFQAGEDMAPGNGSAVRLIASAVARPAPSRAPGGSLGRRQAR
jgi:SAM-dependent methyltransferase